MQMSRVGQSSGRPKRFLQRTVVFYGGDKMTEILLKAFASAKSRWDVCADKMGPTVSMGVDTIKKGTYDMFRRGVKIRYLTEITKENLDFVKELTKMAEVRHLEGMTGGMAVSELEYVAAATLIEKEPTPHLIYSNVKEIVAQQQCIFQALWATAKLAEERMAEVEEGREPEFFESIRDRNEASDIFQSLVITSKEEILLQLPSSKTLEQLQKLRAIDKLVEKSTNPSLVIKVITPVDLQNDTAVKNICERAPGISIRQGDESTNLLLIVDNTKLLSAELTNAQDDDFQDSLGLTVYSNRGQIVRAFESFFETHWKELSLIERLKEHDKEKDEFISVATHELRNPITPILFVIEGLRAELGEREEINRLLRSTKRLQLVVQNLLETTRIDNSNLVLVKETFDLSEVITDAIEDVKLQEGEKKVEVGYRKELLGAKSHLIVADKIRISQVVYNLLHNAVKFTSDAGTIDVSIRQNSNEVSVRIRDYGPGIHKDVLPRLFQKFATKSDKGTGLGLFLCKAIIEAHGGRIVGENNKESAGATFQFTLPIENKM